MSPPFHAYRYWRQVRHLTVGLLAIWLAVTFSCVWFARELSTFVLFGWPLSYYLAAQGVLLVYLLIIGLYAYAMNKLDALAATDARDEH